MGRVNAMYIHVTLSTDRVPKLIPNTDCCIVLKRQGRRNFYLWQFKNAVYSCLVGVLSKIILIKSS